MINAFLGEKQGLALLAPQSIIGAVSSQRVPLAKGHRLAIVVALGTSAASTVAVTLQQHNAASGGVTKVLPVANKYYHKVAGQAVATLVEPTSAASVYTLTSQFSTAAGFFVLEVLAEDLDVNGNFSHVSIDFTAAGVAKQACALFVLHNVSEMPAHLIAMA